MASIPTFGFSAFIGMLFLKEHPQRTKIRDRISPLKKGGRDYHTPFRQGVHQLTSQEKSLEEVVASMKSIKKDDQRNSAINGIERLSGWQALQNHNLIRFGPAIYQSPNSTFRVRFEPDFGLDINGRHTAIHIWNNKASINPTLTLASLTLLRDGYASLKGGPDDWAVLSTKDLVLYRHSETNPSHASLAQLLVEKLEKTFANVRSELGSSADSTLDRGKDHPDKSF